jgi:hypothetical protein
MKAILVACVLGIAVASFACAQSAAVHDAATQAAPDSKQMEKDLQGLPWPKFRAIVEAVPKLRAGVEAYGTAGWQIVQANYTRYHWQKNIDRLDDEQKQQLADLIRAAKARR